MRTLSSKKFEEATKLWQILKIALQDLKWVEKQKNYVVNMGEWYFKGKKDKDGDLIEGEKSEICQVCLAGSVIARRLSDKAEMNEWFQLYPGDFQDIDKVSQKLQALDSLRFGNVLSALAQMEILYINEKLPRLVFPGYYGDKNWWSNMEKILQTLKDYDL